MLTFSVVICAYTEERWSDLLASVSSVQQQTLQANQIIVVIDHNPALLERLQKQWEDQKDLVLTENEGQKGLSGARNSGIAKAKGDIIAFLDDDAIAAPDWLERLSEGYNQPEVTGVGGSIEPLWHNGRPDWFPDEFDWVVGCTYRGMPDKDAWVRNFIGCNMSFKRKLFQAVGGFRLGRVGVLSIGQENDDTEFCIRIIQSNPDLKLLYRPSARVQHRVIPGRKKLKYFIKRCYSEGISKARLGTMVGPHHSLLSEKTYVVKTLPQGFIRELLRVPSKNLVALSRASMLLVGLGITAYGFSKERYFSPGFKKSQPL